MKAGSLAALVVLAGASLGSIGARAETPLERGTYLVNAIAACGDCHTQRGPQGPGPALAGGSKFGDPSTYTAFAANLTPDPETGLGKWTDAEIIKAFREGVRPDGSIVGAPMPVEFYRGISDDDAQAIVAYLRSVPAVKNVVPASVYKTPPKSWGPPVGTVAAVSDADPVQYGKYLAGPVAHCLECHTPNGADGPDVQNELGAGGNIFRGAYGESVSANLTPAGIGQISDADVIKMIRTGVKPDGTHMKPPMGFAAYARMSDRDVGDIVAYLRTLPPK